MTSQSQRAMVFTRSPHPIAAAYRPLAALSDHERAAATDADAEDGPLEGVAVFSLAGRELCRWPAPRRSWEAFVASGYLERERHLGVIVEPEGAGVRGLIALLMPHREDDSSMVEPVTPPTPAAPEPASASSGATAPDAATPVGPDPDLFATPRVTAQADLFVIGSVFVHPEDRAAPGSLRDEAMALLDRLLRDALPHPQTVDELLASL